MKSQGIVAWVDTDASGRIHFTAPFRWVEAAEHALYRQVDPPIEVGTFPRRAVESTYHRPLAAGDAYEVELTAKRVGNSSIAYAWRILHDGELCIEGSHAVVHVGLDGRAAPVPAQLRAVLSPHAPPGVLTATGQGSRTTRM